MGVFSLEWAFDSEGERAGSRRQMKQKFYSQVNMECIFLF
jgi:hypothetical protein